MSDEDRSPPRALALQRRLRDFLMTTMADEAIGDLAAALHYEAVRLLAARAQTEDELVALFQQSLRDARKHIADVGHPHP